MNLEWVTYLADWHYLTMTMSRTLGRYSLDAS